jgi:hypothetical protein
MAGILDFLAEVVTRLNASSVPYMITGSIASTFYSEPRSTRGLDVVVAAPQASIESFVAMFDRNRYSIDNVARAIKDLDQFNIIDGESGWKLDVVIQKDRPFSRSEFDRRTKVSEYGLDFYIATVEDMILAKLEWAMLGQSERQLRDVSSMIDANRDLLDLDYLNLWAAELLVTDQLNRLLKL